MRLTRREQSFGLGRVIDPVVGVIGHGAAEGEVWVINGDGRDEPLGVRFVVAVGTAT